MDIDRPISDREAEVITEAVNAAPLVQDAESFLEGLSSLRVTGRCKCGCASVDFGEPPPPGQSARIADAIGVTDAGGNVGVLVWGSAGRVSALEIFDLGAGQDGLVLPRRGSLRPWPKEPVSTS